MKALIWFIAVVAAAIGLTLAIETNTASVVVIYPPYRVDLSLNLVILAWLSSFVLAYLLVRIVVHTWRLPAYVRRFRRERRREKGRRAALEAQLAYAEGRWSKAEQLAAQAMDLGEAVLESALLAARAAHANRDFKARDDYLARARKADPAHVLACLMTEAELHLDAREVEPAVQAVEELKRLAPKHVGTLRLELKANQLAKNWDGVLATLAQLEKREAIDPTQARQLRLAALLEGIRRRADVKEALEEYWERVGEEDRRETQVAAAAARAFLALSDAGKAREIIEHSLEAQWDSALVALYGQCADRDVIKQIEQAEKWLPAHPRDPALLLALGRLCARQGLWGKAKSYIEASLAVEPTREAHLAAAELLERMNQPDEACRHYRESLALESRSA